METSSQVASEAAAATDVRGKRTKRQQRSVEQKREFVEETLVPGASVARVARAHEVNANQVFAWRRSYRKGQLGNARQRPIRLLPVTVIFALDDLPEKWKAYTERNAKYFGC